MTTAPASPARSVQTPHDTVPALFLATAAARASRVALRHKKRGLWHETTWAEYRDRVERFALGLRSLGLETGERVAILGENGPEWVVADLGVQCAGGVSAGIYTTSSADQCRYVVTHSGARFLILEGEEQLDKWLAFRTEAPLVRHVVVWDWKGLRAFQDAMVLSFDDVLRLGTDAAAAAKLPIERLAAALRPADPALVIYTSGTTGPPKGAILSHRNLAWISAALASFDPSNPYRPDDQVMSFLPLCHIYERLISVVLPCRVGYTVNFVESPDTVPQNLREIAPTIGHGVPRVWEKFASAITLRMDDATRLKRAVFRLAIRIGRARAERRLAGEPVPTALRLAYAAAHAAVFRKLKERLGMHRMRFAVTGAAPIAPDVLRFYHSMGLELTEGYGLTESAGVITATPAGRVRPGSVGLPLPGLELRIAEDGEILARSPGVFPGYLDDREATAAALDSDGWLHTGDVGELDTDGYLCIVDRKKDIIITAGGKNVAPQYIENKLKFSPFILDAVVIGDRRPYLSALIVLDEDNVVKYAQDNKIAFSTFAELAGDLGVERLVAREVAVVNRELARVEQVRRFRILPKRLYQEDGEVTPTMKVKRAAIDRLYAELIETMYADQEQGARPARGSPE